jgi:hypothetical protein
MKHLFFTGVAVAIPLLLASIVIYMFFHGIYTLVSDWYLQRELKKIREESEMRRRSQSQPTDADSHPKKEMTT